MKHGSTTTHLKQKDRQLSKQQLVKAIHKLCNAIVYYVPKHTMRVIA